MSITKPSHSMNDCRTAIPAAFDRLSGAARKMRIFLQGTVLLAGALGTKSYLCATEPDLKRLLTGGWDVVDAWVVVIGREAEHGHLHTVDVNDRYLVRYPRVLHASGLERFLALVEAALQVVEGVVVGEAGHVDAGPGQRLRVVRRRLEGEAGLRRERRD